MFLPVTTNQMHLMVNPDRIRLHRDEPYNPCVTMKRLSTSLLIFALALLPGCKQHLVKRVISTAKIPDKQFVAPEPIITVWVHGTSFTWWRHCPFGLTPAYALPDGSRLQRFVKKLAGRYPEGYSLKTFYAFGWSGRLSFEEREQAAHDLYRLLRKEIMAYEHSYLVRPRVRLICHSHGGNVALNLAKVKQPHDVHFVVDELILLACPVQKVTSNYLLDPMFKKVYALYSRNDLGQIMDPQGLYSISRAAHPVSGKQRAQCPLLSERCFAPHQKLLQGRLRVDGASASHIEFADEHIFTILPTLTAALEECKQEAAGRFVEQENVIYSLRVKTA